MNQLLVLALLGFLGPQQDPSELIDRMQEMAPKEAVSWRVRQVARNRDFYIEKGYEVRVLMRPDEGVQVRFDVLDCALASKKSILTPYNRSTLIFRPDDVHLSFSVLQMEHGDRFDSLPHFVVRGKRGSEEEKAIDPRLISRAFPVFLYQEDPVSTFQSAPKLLFSHEPGLRITGREDFHGKECIVLESVRKTGDLLVQMPDSWYMTRQSVKKFYVDPDTALIEGIRIEIDASNEFGKPEQRIHEYRVFKRQKLGTLDFPSHTSFESWTIREKSTIKDGPFVQRVVFTKSIPAPEKGGIRDWTDSPELAGNLTLIDPEDPKDAASWLLRACHYAAWAYIPRPVAPAKADYREDILSALLKVLDQKPDSWTTQLNVLFLAKSLERADLVERVVDRVKSGKGRIAAPLAARVARTLSMSGEADAALAVLKRSTRPWEPELRSELSIEEMRAHVRRKSVADALKAMDRRLGDTKSIDESLHFIHHLIGDHTLFGRMIRTDAAAFELGLRNRAPEQVAIAMMLATFHSNRREPAKEIELAARIADNHASHPIVMQWLSSVVWRNLGAAVTPHVPCCPNPRLGGVGVDAKPVPARFKSDRNRIRNLMPLAAAAAGQTAATPREHFLLGMIHYKLKDNEAALKSFATAIDLAKKEQFDPNPVRVRAWNHVLGEIARVARMLRDEDLLAETCGLFLELKLCCNPGLDYSQVESVNSASLYGRWLLQRKKYKEVYRILVRAGGTHLKQSNDLRRELLRALPGDKLLKIILPELEEHSEFEALEQVIRIHYHEVRLLAKVLEQAWATAGAEPDMLFRLATYHGRLRDWKLAVSAARESYKRASRMTPDRAEGVGLYLARLEVHSGNLEAAKKILDETWKKGWNKRLNHFGEVYEAVGDFDTAIRIQLESMKEKHGGALPHLFLGRAYYAKENWEEALRWYNNEIDTGSLTLNWPNEEELIPLPTVKEVPPSAPTARQRILERLGKHHFIDRFVKATGETPDKLADEIRALGHRWPEADQKERWELHRKIKNYRKPAAAALREVMLNSEDSVLKTILYEKLSKWAEPH